MIQMQTILDVADNTGARSVMCIKGPGAAQSAAMQALVTSSRLVSRMLRRVAASRRVTCHNAVVVRTAKGVRRPDGSLIRFDNNGGAPEQQAGADRYANLRARDARTAYRALHEDRVARAGSAVRSDHG